MSSDTVPFDADILDETPTMKLAFKVEEVGGRQVRILNQQHLVVWRPFGSKGEEQPIVTPVWKPVPTMEGQ